MKKKILSNSEGQSQKERPREEKIKDKSIHGSEKVESRKKKIGIQKNKRKTSVVWSKHVWKC